MLFKVSNYDHHNLRPTVYFNFLSAQEELCKSSIWNCICIKDKSLKFPSETEDTLYNFHFFWKDSTYTLTDRLQHIFVLWLTTQSNARHMVGHTKKTDHITLFTGYVIQPTSHHITSPQFKSYLLHFCGPCSLCYSLLPVIIWLCFLCPSVWSEVTVE